MAITHDDWRTYRRTRDPQLRDRLILSHLPFVRRVAGTLARRLPPHVSQSDLVSVGAVGLLHAVEQYDPDQLTEFATFAQHRIHGAMLDDLRRQDVMPRWARGQSRLIDRTTAACQLRLGRAPTDEELSLALEIPLSEYYRLANTVIPPVFLPLDALSEATPEDPDAEDWTAALTDRTRRDPFSEAVGCEHARLLRAMMHRLPPQERVVLTLYYVQGLTIKAIGARMGVSEGRVSQIHTAGLRRLLARLQRKRLTRDDLLGDARAAWAPYRRAQRP